MGVGGLFDFVAERVARAPQAIRDMGMEWLWRCAMEPARLWKRYLIGNLIFCGLVIRHLIDKRWANKLEDKVSHPSQEQGLSD